MQLASFILVFFLPLPVTYAFPWVIIHSLKKSLMHLFSDEYLIDLFSKCGFTLEKICVHNKQVENHSLDLVMNRWFLFLPALLMIFTIYLHSELIEK